MNTMTFEDREELVKELLDYFPESCGMTHMYNLLAPEEENGFIGFQIVIDSEIAQFIIPIFKSKTNFFSISIRALELRMALARHSISQEAIDTEEQNWMRCMETLHAFAESSDFEITQELGDGLAYEIKKTINPAYSDGLTKDHLQSEIKSCILKLNNLLPFFPATH